MLRKLCLTAALAICVAAPASAATYTVNSYSTVSGLPSFTFTVASTANSPSYSGYAGPLWLNTAEGNAANGHDLLVYCVDLNHYANTGLPTTYTEGNLTTIAGLPVGTTDGISQQTSNLIGQIAASGLALYGSNNAAAAAAQLAIWHFAYGANVTISAGAVQTAYNTYIGWAGNPNGPYANALIPGDGWPANTGPQEYVTGLANNAPPVPELTTWGMMLLGFAGIGFIAYRRRSADVSLRLA